MRSILATIAVALLLFPSLVFADDGVTTAASVSIGSMAVLVLCAAGSWAIRKFSPSASFAHTTGGAMAVAAGSAVFAAIADAVMTNGLNKTAITQAVLGALLSLFGSSNPSNGKPAAVALMLVPLLILSACGHVPPPPAPNPSVYADAYKSCLENKGMSELGPEGIKIRQILDNPGGMTATQIEAAVEQIGITLGADGAVLVIDCAVDAWVATNPIQPGKSPTPSQVAVRLIKAKHLKRPTAVQPHASNRPVILPDAYPNGTRFAFGFAVDHLGDHCQDVFGYYAPFEGDDGLPVGSYRTDGSCITGDREVTGGIIRVIERQGRCRYSVIKCAQ